MRTSAPLMSLQASGTFANLLTASRWKGRPYLRERVDPSNPQTNAQSVVRSVLGMLAKSAKAVLTSFVDEAGIGSPFFVTARDQAPSGQSWISFLQRAGYNANEAVASAWTALGGTKQGYFTNTAEDIGLIDYVPSFPFGVTYEAGKQLHALAYFASNSLSGDVKDAADLAIAGGSQGDVDAFGDVVHETTP